MTKNKVAVFWNTVQKPEVEFQYGGRSFSETDSTVD